MSLQPARVRNLDAAQHQFSSLHETMNVVADAATNHGANDECRMRNDERNPNDECQNPLRTADAPARRHWATFSFRALGFVINSSLQLEIDNAVRCHDAVFFLHVFERAKIDSSTGSFNQKPARCDIL